MNSQINSGKRNKACNNKGRQPDYGCAVEHKSHRNGNAGGSVTRGEGRMTGRADNKLVLTEKLRGSCSAYNILDNNLAYHKSKKHRHKDVKSRRAAILAYEKRHGKNPPENTCITHHGNKVNYYIVGP